MWKGPQRRPTPRFPPRERGIAYQSNETGRNEIFAAAFPGAGERKQLSTEGGSEPTWSTDSGLYYLGGGVLKSVPVTTTGHLSVGLARPVVPISNTAVQGAQHSYAVTRDNQRVLTPVADKTPDRTPITVVTNWPALVRQ